MNVLSLFDGMSCGTGIPARSKAMRPTRTQAEDLLGDGWTVDVIAHIFKGLTPTKPRRL